MENKYECIYEFFTIQNCRHSLIDRAFESRFSMYYGKCNTLMQFIMHSPDSVMVGLSPSDTAFRNKEIEFSFDKYSAIPFFNSE